MLDSSICEKTELRDCSIRSACPQASCLLIKSSSLPSGSLSGRRWLCWTRPLTLQQPSGAAGLAHDNQQRCLRKSNQGAREEGREERAGDRKPWEAPVGPGQSHLGSVSCLYSLASFRWGELCFQLRCDLPSKYLQILFPNSPGCLVENQFVLFGNN